MTNFIRKLFFFSLMLLFNNPVTLLLIGILNRLCFRPIKSLFIIYPASDKYIEPYCFRFLWPYFRHHPVIIGGFFQGGQLGLTCVISAFESDFESKGFLEKFFQRSTLLGKILGVPLQTYGGVLPNALKRANLLEPPYITERNELVANVVLKAMEEIRKQKQLGEKTPIILLGGMGNIGTAVRKRLAAQKQEIYIVDKQDPFPTNLKNKSTILIDIARKGVLEQYLPHFWKGMLIINETYPEPSKKVVFALKKRGIHLYHIVGVKGSTFPNFFNAYAGGVPCCAMNTSEQFTPLIKLLD